MTVSSATTITLGHDAKLTLAVGKNRYETHWRTVEVLWSDLVARLANPKRTDETLDEFLARPKAEQDKLKDIGGYVGGALKGGRRVANAVAWRSLIALDVDYGTLALLDSLDWQFWAWVAHSTRKHSAKTPRFRILIPLARNVTPDEAQAIGRRVVADLDALELVDDTTYEPHRLMYWPSCSADSDYIHRYQDAPFLDPDAVLAKYADWRDQTQWPMALRFRDQVARAAAKAGDPLLKDGLVGAFCRTYSIHAAIAELLEGAYTAGPGENRYTFTEGTSAGGLVIYEDRWAYSHHGTDPASGKLCNAWDLVRLHKFGDQDAASKPDTPVNKLPSFLAMSDWAKALDPVKRQLSQEASARAQVEFAPVENWETQIDRARSGRPEPTRENVRLILTNDPRLAGRLRWNFFTEGPVAVGDLPWRDSAGESPWTDNDDAGLMHYLEHRWQCAPVVATRDALVLVQQAQGFHPVRDYLEALTWDGTPRVETLLARFLGAADTPYTRAVTRKTLIAAVARVMRPGTKFDYMLTFVGKQGTGKSSLIRTLGGDWFSDSFGTVQGKEAYESLHGAWLIEAAELSGLRRAEVEAVKHFLSKTSDRYRPAYGRRIQTFKRQCVFFGSTNDRHALSDRSGNRRYWMVDIAPTRRPGTWVPELEAERDQIWAEAVTLWRAAEPLWLDDDLEREAEAQQEAHRADDGLGARIAAWLEEPVPADWYDRSLKQRLAHLASSFPYEGETLQRDRVCAREVWLECLEGKEAQFNNVKAKEINEHITALGWTPQAGYRDPRGYGRPWGFRRPVNWSTGDDDVPF